MDKKIKKEKRKWDKAKKSIYLRTFSALLGIYLVLMIGFSYFLITKEKEADALEYNSFAMSKNQEIVALLKEYMDDKGQITDLHKLKKELVIKSSQFGIYDLKAKKGKFIDTELAIFTSDFNLMFNSEDSWICTYSVQEEGSNVSRTFYSYINPHQWFSDEEIKEIENYLYFWPDVKNVGDLSGYSVSLWGFWIENEQIIPEEIRVVPMYVRAIHEDGITSGGDHSQAIVYRSNYADQYVDQKDLPYFEHGNIVLQNIGLLDNKKQAQLQAMVSDRERLIKAVKSFEWGSYQRTGFWTYNHYLITPYETVFVKQGKDPYSQYWLVFGHEVNLWERCSETLGLMWGACFITFAVVAFILASQTYKTYKKREEIERFRKETTNALAHDLKTPLSVISGYAQNLIENVHTDKREYYAQAIEKNVKRMDGIVLEMLELSRLESDTLSLRNEELSLYSVSQEIFEQYKDVCDEKSISTSIEGDALIQADKTLIKRVIENFFVNALDNTPSGGMIQARITGDTFEFYNSGSHIQEENLNEIWQPYKKLDDSRSKKGTGLGLAISKRIFELYRFPYGVKNADEGVVFWFKFGGAK